MKPLMSTRSLLGLGLLAAGLLLAGCSGPRLTEVSGTLKLNGKPIRIPNEEHHTFHLTVFRRLDNPFVMGILEAYWDAYAAVELNRYADYTYLQQVWNYHEQIFEAICKGDYERAKKLFIDHTNLIRYQPRMQRIQASTDTE